MLDDVEVLTMIGQLCLCVQKTACPEIPPWPCPSIHQGVVANGVALCSACGLCSEGSTASCHPRLRSSAGGSGPTRGSTKPASSRTGWRTRRGSGIATIFHGGAREFILVDAEQNTQTPAFDHAKLAEAIPPPPARRTLPLNCRSPTSSFRRIVPRCSSRSTARAGRAI